MKGNCITDVNYDTDNDGLLLAPIYGHSSIISSSNSNDGVGVSYVDEVIVPYEDEAEEPELDNTLIEPKTSRSQSSKRRASEIGRASCRERV